MTESLLSNSLRQRFTDSSQYARLIARTARKASAELTITGLTDSAKSLVLALLHNQIKRPFFLITSDNHEAARYYQELLNFSRYQVFFYPASEISPYEQVASSPDTTAQQMEVLQYMQRNTDRTSFVVLPARALMQRVLDAETLKRETLPFNVGQSIEGKQLAESLVKLGYTREHLVSVRGEFSVRGDIIDIFPSFGPPVRLELFGDEIESMRTFNVESQRSLDEMQSVLVPPRWWVVLSGNEKIAATLRQAMDNAGQTLSDEAFDTLRTVVENDVLAIEAGQYTEGTEYYAPFIHEQFATILDYVPDDALIFTDEWETVSQSLLSYQQKLEDTLVEGLAAGRLLPLPRNLHPRVDEIVETLKVKQRAFICSMPTFGEDGEQVDSVNFACHGIERFNGQIPQFVEKVRQWRREGYRVIVTSEQAQRVIGLLKEWDCPASYVAGHDLSHDGKSAFESDDGNGKPAAPQDAKVDNLGTPYVIDQNEVWVTRQGFVGAFRLDDVKIISVTEAELFGVKRKPATYRRPVADKTYERFYSVSDLKIGDFVVHAKQGIGEFIGIERVALDGQEREFLSIQYAGDDRLYVPVDQVNLLSRYRGAGGITPRLSRMGGAEWESTKRRVKRSIKQVAEDLTNLYAVRAKQEGFACPADAPWQYEMEEAFPFEETPDQWQAIVDTKKDLESNKPMDRLICGDVGFGKTEVAVRAIFKMVMSGKQAAVLVPTTILAQQHFNTLVERFAAYPIKVGLLSRFRTAKEQREVTQRLALGECDVVVGTHRLLQKDIAFKDLGLVVIDEEQRFGVAHKEKLKHLRVMVDVLTMSATPIPRTLYMALSGARDMSLINTPPVNRAPIKTFVGEYKPALLRTAILHELERGGQIYVVHNRVETIENVALEVKELVPEARIAIGHGQMNERDLEAVMLDFYAHQTDILVCTTIIESGLDIPNVNTIIVDEADRLGLAQMYQLRGRVGRSDVQAYAYCLFRGNKVLSETAQSRLKAIRELTHLGSGYQIALRDMEIRGVGNILGAEQHGHMVAIGFDLYCKMLEESVAELKGEETAGDLDTQIDINVTAFIPETYMADADQKIIEYKRLADVRSERELVILTEEWRDRFGQLPVETQQLVAVVRLRLIAAKANVSSIKPDPMGMGSRLAVDFRLQAWLPIQNRLPKHLATRTTYKPGSAGGHGSSPYILVRTQGLTPPEQLDLLEELLSAMVGHSAPTAA